jgi:hypothetical protein
VSKGLLPHICAALLTSHVPFSKRVYLATAATYHETHGSSFQKCTGAHAGSTKHNSGIVMKYVLEEKKQDTLNS